MLIQGATFIPESRVSAQLMLMLMKKILNVIYYLYILECQLDN
jgi:hypothetical protein